MESPYLTMAEAAEYLRLSYRQLRRLIANGDIEPLQPTPKGKCYFTKEMLNAFLQGQAPMQRRNTYLDGWSNAAMAAINAVGGGWPQLAVTPLDEGEQYIGTPPGRFVLVHSQEELDQIAEEFGTYTASVGETE